MNQLAIAPRPEVDPLSGLNLCSRQAGCVLRPGTLQGIDCAGRSERSRKVRIRGTGRVELRPACRQVVNDAVRRATSERGASVLCQFHLISRKLEQAARADRQGRVASGRALSARRLHRHQPVAPGRAGRRLLQQARHMRAMDQRGQRSDQVDAAVVPLVRRQRRAAPASCARLHSRKFPTEPGDARTDQGLVADELEGEADQDRREGSEPRTLCRLSDGRSRHPATNVPGGFCG